MSYLIFLSLLNKSAARFLDTPQDYVMIIVGVIIGIILAIFHISHDERKRWEEKQRTKIIEKLKYRRKMAELQRIKDAAILDNSFN